MADQSPSYSFDDPTLYLFTSLTAGSSHIITATSRLETILKANKIGFRAIDVATDDKARMLWGTRSRGRKLPGLVKHGNVLADIVQVEEWNEYGELKAQVHGDLSTSPVPPSMTTTPNPPVPRPALATTTTTTSSSPHIQIVSTPSRTPSAQSKQEDRLTLTLRQASEEAAAKAKENSRTKLAPLSPSSITTAENTVAEKALLSAEEKPPTAPITPEKKELGEGKGEGGEAQLPKSENKAGEVKTEKEKNDSHNAKQSDGETTSVGEKNKEHLVTEDKKEDSDKPQ